MFCDYFFFRLFVTSAAMTTARAFRTFFFVQFDHSPKVAKYFVSCVQLNFGFSYRVDDLIFCSVTNSKRNYKGSEKKSQSYAGSCLRCFIATLRQTGNNRQYSPPKQSRETKRTSISVAHSFHQAFDFAVASICCFQSEKRI